MTRLSPSRTSTVFRSFAAISLTICSSRPTSIGLSDERPDRLLDPAAPLDAPPLPPFRFPVRFSLNVAALETAVEARQHLAPGVGDQHVVLDPHAPFAGQVDPRLDGHDHSRPQLFVAAGLAHRRQLVDLAADAVAQPVPEL